MSERERRDEDAENARKAGLMEARERERALMRQRKSSRETLESRAGARTLGVTGKNSVSPDGSVKNLPRYKTPMATTIRQVEPYLGGNESKSRANLFSSPNEKSLSSSTASQFDLRSLSDFPDIHSSYHAKSRMSNVLTVKRLDRGRFVPVNKAAIKVREGTGTTLFSMGDRSVHF